MRRIAWLVLLAACESTPPAPSNYVETIPGSAVAFEMIYIPAPAPFWIGRTEVTWDEFELYFLSPPEGDDAVARPSPAYEPPDRGMGRGKRPATSIRLQAAEKYCEWLSKKTGKAYRLPTEAEWEVAAADASADDAWHAGNSNGSSQDVATKKPNRFGVHDMLGNLWEYCATADPVPVMRGGCWKDPPEKLSTKSRQTLPDGWSRRDPQRPKSPWWLTDGQYVGFRVLRSAN